MAISFSRPNTDGSGDGSGDDSGEFRVVRRGLDPEQVHERITALSTEVERLREVEASLRAELSMAQRPIVGLGDVDPETLAALVGEETAGVLAMARETAVQSRQRAEDEAVQIVAAAYEEAARVRESVQEETTYLRRTTAEQAETELASARARGLEMVTEAREYREKVLADLAQRRDLAREQIRALIDGRDRLMRAFEVARLASVDMLAELEQAIPVDDGDPTPVSGVASPDPSDGDHAGAVLGVFDGDAEMANDDESAMAVSGATDAEVSVLVASESPFHRRRLALDPLVESLTRHWRRIMVDEQNDVLAAVRRSTNLSSIGELLPDEEAHIDRYGASLAEVDAAIDAGIASVGAGPEGRDRTDATAVARAVLMEDLILPLRERLERVIETSGGNRFELSAYVRSSYREWKQQLESHATDSLVAAFAAGAYAGLDTGALVVWQPDPEGPSCSEVAANAGVVIRVPDHFPSGHAHPPATRACRCLIQRLPD